MGVRSDFVFILSVCLCARLKWCLECVVCCAGFVWCKRDAVLACDCVYGCVCVRLYISEGGSLVVLHVVFVFSVCVIVMHVVFECFCTRWSNSASVCAVCGTYCLLMCVRGVPN